jgi:hypothetical protein
MKPKPLSLITFLMVPNIENASAESPPLDVELKRSAPDVKRLQA